MKRLSILILVVFSLISCSEPQPTNAFVKGSFGQIQQTYQDKPHLIVFWSQDCAYCMKEFTFLAEVMAQSGNIKLITVATDPFLSSDSIQMLHQTNNLMDAERWVFSDPISEKLYFDVDKSWRGELPLMFLVNDKNEVTKHMGIMTQAKFVTWIKQHS